MDRPGILVMFQSSEADQGEKYPNQSNDQVNNSTHGPPPFIIIFQKNDNNPLKNLDEYDYKKVPKLFNLINTKTPGRSRFSFCVCLLKSISQSKPGFLVIECAFLFYSVKTGMCPKEIMPDHLARSPSVRMAASAAISAPAFSRIMRMP